ncbi:hypothetical protein shim_22000 [Shimia sp. SK013]|uniref:hypothetical protein n=1 Tax=Shimia sp. SK013 TaxID=1389006 RepID=UPI0006CDFDE2|nr:hypothetical protein [Shimia sp. SK013]KPA21493.1 hypothetical protein shim_22000 [Shimia sp. SK013]
MPRLLTRPILMTLTCTALLGCGQFPDVVGEVDDDIAKAPYPLILPNTEALVAETPRLHSGSDDALDARERRLRRRAQNLLE